MMISNLTDISYLAISLALLGAIVIGALLTAMRLKHKYRPNLIGAIVGALLCFAIIEALPLLAP
jgi:uncharacterized membrane protein YeaQ/YmgE (transglycosylase-associated protein family)